MDSLFYQLGKLPASSSSPSSPDTEQVDSDPGQLPRQLAPLVVAVIVFGLAVVVFPATPLTLAGYVALALAIVTVYDAIEIVQAYEERTLTVFGDHKGTLELGLSVVPPFVSRTYHSDMRTQTLDVPSQGAITEDNSSVTVDAVVYIRVVSPKRALLQIGNHRRTVSLLAQATLRATLDDMELNDTLARCDHINTYIRQELDGPIDERGVRVESVEAREVKPPKDAENAMEQQTSAERRRRAIIPETRDEHRSAVEKAEGDKQSNIIRVQGEKQSQVLEAQGDAILTMPWAHAAESMGERVIIDKDMGTLANIDTSPSTTHILPQGPASLLSCHGERLSGLGAQQAAGLESETFDEETHELLGLDDIGEIFEELDDVETVDVSAGTVGIEIEDGDVK